MMHILFASILGIACMTAGAVEPLEPTEKIKPTEDPWFRCLTSNTMLESRTWTEDRPADHQEPEYE